MISLSSHKFTHNLVHHRRFRAALVLLMTLAVVLGIIIVPFEALSAHARIHTIGDGLWWSVTTVTGVGYGDMVPVTAVGRIIGAVLEISGVLMFGLIIGIIGITLTKRQEEYTWFRLFERLDQLEQKLENLEKKNSFLVEDKK